MEHSVIKLSVETRDYETLFRMINFDELGDGTILELEKFAKNRGGMLKYGQKLFYVKKRWDGNYAKKVFDALGLPVEIVQDSSADVNEALHLQRVYFGKHYGKKWEEIPENYLRYLIASHNSHSRYAQIELTRRGESTADVEQGIDGTIHFGKYKGRRWAELPLEYLKWLRDNLDITNKDYVLIEKAIAVREG